MPSIGDLFRPFGRRLTTFWKLLLVGVAIALAIVGHILLGIIGDVVKDKGENWLFDASQSVISDAATRARIDHLLLNGSKHPTLYIIVAFGISLLLIAFVSAGQVWWAIEHGKLQTLSAEAAPSSNPGIHLPLATFDPILPDVDKQSFDRADAPDLRQTGQWLRRVEQQWKECGTTLAEFSSLWNRFVRDYPGIQGRMGFIVPAQREIGRARDAFAKELESLLELFGGRQDANQQKELWAPLSDQEKKALRRGIGLLGKHTISIACATNVDCMKRAKEFADLFLQQQWTTKFLGPAAYGALGAVAIRVLGKEGYMLAHELQQILFAVLGGTIDCLTNLNVSSEIDLLLVVGPKPPSDWR